MTSLYITVSSQLAYDPTRSCLAGALNYSAPSVFGLGSQIYIYDYGVSNNPSATPFPVFTGDTDARSYLDSVGAAALITAANTMMTSSYYSTYTINLVAAPVQADFSALAPVATSGSYLDLTNTPAIQACSGCGVIVPKGLGDRWHECPDCGLSLDRDENAARNILARSGAMGSQRKAVAYA